MKKVYTTGNIAEAHMLRGILASHGIASEVQGEALSSLWGALPVEEMLPTVWIEDEGQLEIARQVIDDFERRCRLGEGETSADTWVCSNCGERLEGQFSACWRCGADRIDD